LDRVRVGRAVVVGAAECVEHGELVGRERGVRGHGVTEPERGVIVTPEEPQQ
jgi:hypothetical protein